MNRIEEYVGKQVLLKFNNGRTISGTVRGDRDAGFTVKLGVRYIPLDGDKIASISSL